MRLGTIALAALLLGSVSCTNHRQYYFAGRVYDGVTGARITNYKLELQYIDREANASVDKDGRYLVGPLTPFHDYTIAITATGYRSFLSHNVAQPDPAPAVDTSFYFDAYLFPTAVTAPAATFHITTADGTAAPSGRIRLRPTVQSAFYDTAAEQPAGVLAQVWGNDEDLQFDTVTKDFADGTASFAEGELVYGVTYAVTIFNVPGHQMGTGVFVSGQDDQFSITLNPYVITPLALAFASNAAGTIEPTGQLVLAFNQPIELDPTFTQNTYLTSIENGFGIVSPDKDLDGTLNTLKTPVLPPGGMGLAMAVDTNRLTFTWNPTAALATSDTGDPIRTVTWGNLDEIFIRAADSPPGTAFQAVSVLTGATTATVTVSAQ